MSSPALGMLFGFINTTTLHLAKGMQRHGIATLRWRSLPRDQRSGRHAVIYLIGVVLNNLAALWIVLANRFAPPAYASGMFGLGLIVLLVYARAILGERISGVSYLGSALIILGTAAFALDAFRRPAAAPVGLTARTVWIFALAWLIGATLLVLVALARRRAARSRALLAVAFGIFSGGLGGLDPVLKAIGQTAGGSLSIVPTVAAGWIPFGLSFLVGTAAFFSVQYGFLLGADASTLVPIQSALFVLIPVVVQLIALTGYDLSGELSIGVALIVIGIVVSRFGGTATAAVEPSVEV